MILSHQLTKLMGINRPETTEEAPLKGRFATTVKDINGLTTIMLGDPDEQTAREFGNIGFLWSLPASFSTSSGTRIGRFEFRCPFSPVSGKRELEERNPWSHGVEIPNDVRVVIYQVAVEIAEKLLANTPGRPGFNKKVYPPREPDLMDSLWACG